MHGVSVQKIWRRILGGVVMFLIGFFLLRYLNGFYDIEKSEKVRSGSVVDEGGKVVGYYEIHRITYKNGRVKLKEYSR